MSHEPQTLPDAPTPAPRSGGPKTPEGKERSRRNALKHGLRAKVLTPNEMIDDVMNRTCDFAKEFQPRTVYQEWLVGEIALATVRIDRCAALSIVDLQRRMNHTDPCWDLDQRRDVAALGAGLKRDPARIRAALEATRHGVNWLIAHWDGLAQTLQSLGDWDDDQQRLALDLLGTPPELRRGSRQLPEPADLPAFVQGQIARLRGLQESYLNDQDDDQRTLAGFGMATVDDPTTANLRRYERSHRRTLRWAQAELKRLQAEPAEPTEHAQEPPPQPKPEPTPLPPRHGSDRLRKAIATGTKIPGPGHPAQFAGDFPTGNHFDLDIAIAPARPAAVSAAPARPPMAGKRA